MEYEGCWYALGQVIDDASEEFGERYVINQEKYDKLDEICSLVDDVICILDDDFGYDPETRENMAKYDTITVDVDTATKDLIFNIVCDEIVLHNGRTHRFFDLAQLVDFIRFSKAKPDNLRIEIGVSELWRVRI